MGRDGQPSLTLLNAHGELLGDNVDINPRNHNLSDNGVAGASASKTILIKDLLGTPQRLCRLEMDPPSYLLVWQFVNLKASSVTGLEVTFLVDSHKVKSVTFPGYQDFPDDLKKLFENSDKVFSLEGKSREALYGVLDRIQKAGLLNILKKAGNTRLSNGETVFPHLQKRNELLGDRFFAVASRNLREETKNSVHEDLFHSAPGLHHHSPVEWLPKG